MVVHHRQRSRRYSRSGETSPVPESSSGPEFSSVPDSNQSSTRNRLTIEQLVQQPNRTHCMKLDPELTDGTWFGVALEIKKSILRMLHNMLRHPYKTYSEMPLTEKDSWHRTFAQEFTWDHWRTRQVLDEFDKVCAIQYSRHMNEWKQRFLENKGKHKDLADNVWTGFCEYWSQESTKLKAAINSKNRKSTRDGRGVYVHNGGAKSTIREVAEMTVEAGGVIPDYLVVMEKRHTNKKTGEIQDLGVREVVGKCKRKKSDRLTQLTQEGSPSLTELPRKEINHIVLSTTDQVKGRFLGLGQLPIIEGDVASTSSFRFPRERFETEIEELKQAVSQRDAMVEEIATKNANLETKYQGLEAAYQSTRNEVTQMKEVMQSSFPNLFNK